MIAFGVVVLLVLLNVVVAVVSEAWDTASEQSLSKYWSYRLQKITEWMVLAKSNIDDTRIFQWIDKRPDVSVEDNIPWLTHAPYNKVQFKKQFDYPHDYFCPMDAEKIVQGHSLQASLYWAKRDNEFLRDKKKRNGKEFSQRK